MAWAIALKLPTREKFVLLMLANYAGERGEAWPSTLRLAEDTGMSRSTVIEALRKLEATGAMRVERRMQDGVNLPNIYHLHLGWRPNDAADGGGSPPAGLPVGPGGVVRQPEGGSPGAGHEPVIEPITTTTTRNAGARASDAQAPATPGPAPTPTPAPPAARSPPERQRPSFDFETGAFVDLQCDLFDRWSRAYPALDVVAEVNRAAAWLYANPSNRKSDYVRFLTNWLARAQDRAPRSRTSGAPAHEPPRRTVTDERAEWLARATGRAPPPGDPDTIDG